jgi:hypothetical protein
MADKEKKVGALRINGRNFYAYLWSIKEALKGKTILFSSLGGDVAILSWDKFEKLTGKNKSKIEIKSADFKSSNHGKNDLIILDEEF